jgi:hypothetical protein
MKIRSSFVANSSSSSFICGVCDILEIDDYSSDPIECEKCEHSFHRDCLDIPKGVDPYDEEDGTLLEKYCPVCSKNICTDNIRRMWVEMFGDPIEEAYKQKFKSFAEFKAEFCKFRAEKT